MVLIVLGSLFVLAGGGVTIAIAVGSAPSPLLLMGIIFIVTGLLMTGIGLLIAGSARRRKRILATGIPGTARITSVTQTSVMVNEQPVLRLELVVSVPGRADFPASVRQVVPLIRLVRLQPGALLPVKVDPHQPDQVAIDWDAPPPDPMTDAAGPVLRALAGVAPEPPGALAPPATPSAVPGLGMPGGPVVPAVPPSAASLPRQQLREQVRAVGASGRAIVDAVQQLGPDGDQIRYQLGMWIQLDSGPSFRVDNTTASVDLRYADRVVPGVIVPVRIAQVKPGVTVTVLEWEKL